jgi:hypothetical protein
VPFAASELGAFLASKSDSSMSNNGKLFVESYRWKAIPREHTVRPTLLTRWEFFSWRMYGEINQEYEIFNYHFKA